MSNLIKTGRTFESKKVDLGHKKGKLCLTCGIYVDGLCCDSCKLLSKCKLCGIVCKVHPTNKIYSYIKTKDKNISAEVYREVKTFCQKLEGDLCEACQDWETRMKHVCFICTNPFENSMKDFKEKGNCCDYCHNDMLISLKKKLSTV